MPRRKASADNDEPDVDLTPETYEDPDAPDDAPKTQADLWLGGQFKVQQEARRQEEEERREREELHRNRTPTGRTKREQEAGEKMLADHESGGRGGREAKVGKEALKSYDERAPS